MAPGSLRRLLVLPAPGAPYQLILGGIYALKG